MKIEIKKHNEYTIEKPKTIVSCFEKGMKDLVFDEDIDNGKISKFLFSLLEKNENQKIDLIFDKEEYKDDQFLMYVYELFREFINLWNNGLNNKNE